MISLNSVICHTVSLKIALLATVALAADENAIDLPKWRELAVLLGKPIESGEVENFVKKHELKQYHKFDEGGFVPYDNSYSLLFDKNRISTIVLRISPLPKGSGEPHWKPFSKSLPGGLKATDSSRDIFKKLGPPIQDQKNRWRFEDLVIWVHFEDDSKTIAELFINSRPAK